MSSPYVLDMLAERYALAAAEVSLHSDDPGEFWDFEFARLPIYWSSGPGVGEVTTAGTQFTVPEATNVHSAIVWSDQGDYMDTVPIGIEFPDGGYYSFSLTHKQL